jgi:hypothetical protein
VKFSRFVGIDWSGAKGMRHPSIQVAVADAGNAAPRIVVPASGIWSRQGVLDWLAAADDDVLIGIDAGFGFAAVPGFETPAKTLWAEVDAVCADDLDLGGHAFIANRRDAFWLGAADGPRHLRAHLRRTEAVYAASKLGQPTSNFVLLGASQVGKATLSAMRLLHRQPHPVWPFDPVPAHGPLLVEIYAQAFARMAGNRGKIRDRTTLDLALEVFGSAPLPSDFAQTFPDHVGDALITAAGLRAIAHQPHWWMPAAMTAGIAQIEGWTFGVA